MNRAPAAAERRNIGFSGLLFPDGHVVAASLGLGHACVMRNVTFVPLAREFTKKEKLVNMGVLTEEEAEIELKETLAALEDSDETDQGPVIISEPIAYAENDKYLLISHAVFNSLGEERIEDILAQNADSNILAAKLVSEAVKRSTNGDLTVMIVQIEKVYEQQQSTRKPAMKARVDALHKIPAVTYKHGKKKETGENIVFIGIITVTVILLLGIVYMILKSFFAPPVPSGSAIATNKPTASASVQPTTEATPTPQVTETSSTPSEPGTHQEEIIYEIKSGDTMSVIATKYYKDVSMAAPLLKYNKIANEKKIQIGQKIKIPPIEVLKALN